MIGLSLSLMARRRLLAVPSQPVLSPFATNTLVGHDLRAPGEWSASRHSASAPTSVAVYDATAGAAYLVNAGLNAPSGGILAAGFTAPAGCTSVELQLRMQAPSGLPTGEVRIGVYTADAAHTLVGTALTVATTGGRVTTTHAVAGLTAGVHYLVKFECNVTSQTAALVEYLKVRPTSGTGWAAGNFVRQTLDHSNALYDGTPWAGYYAPPGAWSIVTTGSERTPEGLPLTSSGASWQATTDATSVALEAFLSGPPVGSYAEAILDRAGTHTLLGTPTYGYFIVPQTVPAGTKTLTWRNSPGQGVSSEGYALGSRCKAAYYATSTLPTVPPAPLSGVPTVLAIVDSIGSVFNDTPGLGPAQRIHEAGTCRFLLDGYSGRQFRSIASTPSVAQAYLDNKIAAVTFDRLFLQVVSNDAFNAGWASVADYKTALADFADRYHAKFPGKALVVQTPFVRQNSYAPAFRLAIYSVAATRPWMVVLEGAEVYTMAQTTDDIHPGPAASPAAATFMARSATATISDPPYGGSLDPATLSPIAGWDVGRAGAVWQDTAGTTAVTTAGESIARVDDWTGNGHHAAQSTIGSRPAYSTTAGPDSTRKAAVFGSKWLTTVDSISTGECTYVLVAKQGSTVDGLLGRGASFAEYWFANLNSGGALYHLAAGQRGAAADVDLTSDGSGDASYHVWELRIRPGATPSVSFWRDGTLVRSSNAAITTAALTATLTLGAASSGGSGAGAITLLEGVVLPAGVTDTQLAQVVTHYKIKHGLT